MPGMKAPPRKTPPSPTTSRFVAVPKSTTTAGSGVEAQSGKGVQGAVGADFAWVVDIQLNAEVRFGRCNERLAAEILGARLAKGSASARGRPRRRKPVQPASGLVRPLA